MPEKNQILVELVDQVGQRIKEKLCDPGFMADGLTMSQFQLLHLLAQHQRLTMAQIAKELKIKPASATSLVDRLVKREWLVRKEDVEDRRRVFVEIAPAKQKVWMEWHQEKMVRLSNIMDVLDEKQKDDFISILETIVKND